LEYRGTQDLFRTPEFHKGSFELQDINSQAVGIICEPKPGETWWDACAGEGGKLLHLSELMENKGLIWASDRVEWRLKKLKQRTARVAGTEKGVKEPQATFSTCFGAPFMPRHPTVYAKMLGEKMARQHVKCWLVNTGWSGGGFGVGERMSIRHTRAMVRAALDGTLAAAASSTDPHFGMQVPSACPDVPGEVLNPKNTWKDKKAYDTAARDVAKRFEANFQQFESHVDG
jgi:hypothetical protein